MRKRPIIIAILFLVAWYCSVLSVGQVPRWSANARNTATSSITSEFQFPVCLRPDCSE